MLSRLLKLRKMNSDYSKDGKNRVKKLVLKKQYFIKCKKNNKFRVTLKIWKQGILKPNFCFER